MFHFSEDPDVRVFEPRPVRVGIARGPELAWLNGPLVWAIDAAHSLLYLFPRDCPRIVIWPRAETTPEDRATWFGDVSVRAVAYVEAAWADRITSGTIQRYRMPAATFVPTGDPGAWVSHRTVVPDGRETIRDLPAALAAEGVDLRIVARLTPLAPIWRSSLHASGIRLRNAQDWVPPEGGPPRPITLPP
ncbi:hypothetical protein ASF49_09330 [Methylobacterium sp. Leaf104]|nr:DUF6886 family protein [Methylobacterium goesingense]KQP31896.1 hypothetical protein ASF49_09330 [Methylobacterium sp. Leaf104]MCI9880542.1 hypothetical protein [Methylobacterium goesingense]